MLAPSSWMAPEPAGGFAGTVGDANAAARVRLAAAFATAAARDDELRQFVAAEAQLRALAVHPDFHTNEDKIYELLMNASKLAIGLEAAPPADSKAMDDALRLLKTILGLCTAWMRLASSGCLVEGCDGLRSATAAEFAFGTVESLIASSSGLGASMTLAFQELGGLSLMGKALCYVEQASFGYALRGLRVVAARISSAARQGGSNTDAVASSIEDFRGNLIERVQHFASSPNRRLRIRDFKDIVNNIGGVFNEAYASSQVFEITCLLSLKSALALLTHREDASDGVEAMEWFGATFVDLLAKQTALTGGQGVLSSPLAVREWLEDAGFWNRLVMQTSSRVQLHVHPVFTALLSCRVFSPRDLAEALAKAGAFTKGAMPTSCRVALQSALLVSASNLDTEVVLQLLADLCDLWTFDILSHEGVDLLTRLTVMAYDDGYQMRLGDAASERLLALSYLLRFLQWGYRKEGQPPEHFEILDFAEKMLINVLLPHPVLSELLPAIAAHALTLAVEPYEGSTEAAGRCSKVLTALALTASGIATVGHSRVAPDTAIAVLCSAFPRVGAVAPFDHKNKEYWLAALVDALCIFLRQPDAEIGGREIATLWSRLVVRPVFGLSVPFAAGQYFKLAFLAQPSPSATILAPYLAAPNPPHEISLAFTSLYRPAHLEEQPPPTPPIRLFPQAAINAEDVGPMLSPPRLPQPLRHSLSSDGYDEHWVDLATSASIAKAAATAGIAMAEPSTSVPRMRLDRVQAVHSSPGTGLFGELTVYDATERRLWDEFDELGRIDDAEALRQRDAAARRCLAALDKEIDAVGRAGRELPSALAEARAKFSLLSQLVVEGAEKASQRLSQAEISFAKAEDELIAATSSHRRALARCRRQGEAPSPPEEISAARDALIRAHLELVKEIRLAAQSAQLGLVEITGTPGFARAIRAAGPAHADPLLERLLRHRPWCDQQATCDPLASGAVSSAQAPEITTNDMTAEALLENAVIDLSLDTSLSTGTGGTSPIGKSGRSKLVRGRSSQAVVFKAFAPDEKDSCLQEVRALQKLKGHPNVISLLKVMKSGDGTIYLEMPFCAGGSMLQWCKKFGTAILQGDPDTFVRCLSIWRQIWQAVGYLHLDGVFHGHLTLDAMLLTAEQRPVLTDFSNCVVTGTQRPAEMRFSAEADYTAPELEVLASAIPTAASDVFSAGVAMAKAFMGIDLQVSSCLYHPTRGQRSLPEERVDVDLADLLQQLLNESPASRPTAPAVASHRALDPAGFLRRRGLLGNGLRTPAQAFLEAAEVLREEYRGRRVDESLMFSRDTVFDTISTSKVGEWREDALLGEWRVILNDESGVDGGGLRREVVSLFFEQLEKSSLVMRAGMDGSEVVTLFVNDRRRADKSPQQWRQTWTSVGAMLLRALVHFGNAPLAFSSAIFDCALGRLCKLPPDDIPGGDDDDDTMASIDRLLQLREEKGDDWARSELLDLLRRLRRADPQKEAGYRWMLSQRIQEEQGGVTVHSLSTESMETITAMLETRSASLLDRLSSQSPSGFVLPDASLEWVLLWDVYLKFLGGGDRWLAYEALADGFTAHGRHQEMWSVMTGDQILETLDGVPLTADVILPNLEFKPGYGYETQIQFFKNVMQNFDSEELSMFLRFSTGIGRLPASRRFPAGQKLTIRFMPDQLEHLPSAHTCFWVVDVPPYEDQEDMAKKLRLAIAAPQPFELS